MISLYAICACVVHCFICCCFSLPLWINSKRLSCCTKDKPLPFKPLSNSRPLVFDLGDSFILRVRGITICISFRKSCNLTAALAMLLNFVIWRSWLTENITQFLDRSVCDVHFSIFLHHVLRQFLNVYRLHTGWRIKTSWICFVATLRILSGK